jgi:hypothetical protein
MFARRSGRPSSASEIDQFPCFSVTPIGHPGRVQTAVEIVLGVFLVLPVLVVLGLFVWAARKDGEEDKAVQKHIGIRRKTRLGL